MKFGMQIEVDEWCMTVYSMTRSDPIQGQCHEPFRVGNPAIFNNCLLRNGPDFFIFGLDFVSCDFEVGRNVISGVDRQSHVGLIYYFLPFSVFAMDGASYLRFDVQTDYGEYYSTMIASRRAWSGSRDIFFNFRTPSDL